MKPTQQYIRSDKGELYRIDEIEEMRARRAGGGLFYVAFRVAGEWKDENLMVDGELADLLRARSMPLMQSIERDMRRHREELMIAAVNNETEATEKAEAWMRALTAPSDARRNREFDRIMKLAEAGDLSWVKDDSPNRSTRDK